MRMRAKRCLAMVLVAAVVSISIGRAEAMLAPPVSPTACLTRSQDLQTVQTFLEQKEVGQHLLNFDLTRPEVESRLNNLSDRELHQVATRIHQQQPGRDGVVGVLVVIILVLLIVYLFKRV